MCPNPRNRSIAELIHLSATNVSSPSSNSNFHALLHLGDVTLRNSICHNRPSRKGDTTLGSAYVLSCMKDCHAVEARRHAIATVLSWAVQVGNQCGQHGCGHGSWFPLRQKPHCATHFHCEPPLQPRAPCSACGAPWMPRGQQC